MLLGNSLHYDRKPIRDDQGRQKGTDETYTLRTEQPLSQVKGGFIGLYPSNRMEKGQNHRCRHKQGIYS